MVFLLLDTVSVKTGIENTEVDEGDKTDVTVRLTRASSEAVTVSWITEDGTAESDVDYQYTFDSLEFEANKKETDHNIEVQTYNNGPYKPMKQFYIKLIPGVTLIDIEEHTVTIDVTNSKPKFYFLKSHVEVNEGEPVNLEVRLSRPSSQTVTVRYEITDDHDLLEPETTAGNLVFNPNDMTQSIGLVTSKSNAYHSGKTLSVKLSGADNAYTGDNNNTTVTVKFGAPDKPELKVAFNKAKTFSFSWDKSERAEYYKLFEKLDDQSGFTDLNISPTSSTSEYDHIVPIFTHANAVYKLKSCNQGDVCSDDSNYVYINQSLTDLADSIGKIANPESNNSDQGFGRPASVSRDGNTIALGAIKDSSNSTGVTNNTDGSDIQGALKQADVTNSGAVYIYKRNDNNAWELQAYIKADNADQGDFFGNSISLSADGSTLAVGASREDASNKGISKEGSINNGSQDSGAVYIYKRDEDNTWSLQAYIKASNAGNRDQFGYALSLNADGTYLAVGAPHEDSGGTSVYHYTAAVAVDDNNGWANIGAVYLYKRDDQNGWVENAFVKPANGTLNGSYQFGTSVSLNQTADVLAVGAPYEDGNDPDADTGAVYVYKRNANYWDLQRILRAYDPDKYTSFGTEIDLSDDGNTLAVGAGGWDHGGDVGRAGAVYMYSYNATSNQWSNDDLIRVSNGKYLDGFGYRLSLNGDGNTLAVSAKSEDSALKGIHISSDVDTNGQIEFDSDYGAVYIFTNDNSHWLQKTYIKANAPAKKDHFGESVTLSGDGKTLVVGSEATDNGSEIFNKVYIY